MNKGKFPRIEIVGTHSGSGKTTVVCAILKALQQRGLQTASFKCGPDYIDPMFHSRMIGSRSRNLDIFMCGEDTVRFLLARNAAKADFSVIEGVMGMYDGLAFDSQYASSNHVAMLTSTPEILVVNVKGMSVSVAALVSGYLHYHANNIKGVIFNNCSKAMYPMYQKLIETSFPLKAYGFLPIIPEAVIGSRHLGLITADEIKDLDQKLDKLGEAAEQYIDISGLLELGGKAEELEYPDMWQDICPQQPVRIGVARDKAFCFFYEDNFDLLRAYGAEIVYFSPLDDACLPENIDGLILCGGYPEEHAAELAANLPMLHSIRQAVEQGLPTIAECGGFMYLLQELEDKAGQAYAMAGVVPGKVWLTERLSRFGYITLTANQDNLLCRAGESIPAHEFHYSDSNNNGEAFTASKKERCWDCIHCTDNLFGGYPHIHFGGNHLLAGRFIANCVEYNRRKK